MELVCLCAGYIIIVRVELSTERSLLQSAVEGLAQIISAPAAVIHVVRRAACLRLGAGELALAAATAAAAGSLTQPSR